ncbi:sensor histidine kinase [Metaclostridioides mangenotii]|uniref:sensor histidine kinase n=1 Tax=Metaclostridioides mangenotii TaxID=1540 RepID=UPI0004854A1E|nr:sensor histidine kinase [Clostridioides mangenotii]
MINNNEFWHIFELLISTLEISAFFYFVNDRNKIKSKKKIIFSYIIFIVLLIMINTSKIGSNTRATLGIIMSLVFYKFNYNINIIKCIAGTLIFWMMLISFDTVSMVFVKFANSLPNFNPIFVPGIFRIELISISKTLLILAIIYSKYFKLLIKITSKDFIYLIIPMLTNIFSLFLLFGKDIIHLSNYYLQDVPLVIISILVIFSNIFLLFIILKIIRDNTLIEEIRLKEEKKNIESNYYKRVEENNYKVRKLYHDMKNHIICIGNLCDSDEAMRYVESLKFELSKLDNIYNTGNKVLDIILNEKSYICLNKGIKLTTYIDFSKSNFIEMADINAIFSNALDNAIQACGKIEDLNINKEIEIRTKYINNFSIIKIINIKTNKVNINKNKLVTDKKDEFLHGFGINNIKEVVEKYNGEVVIENTDEKFVLTILIPLPNNNK